MGSNGLTLPSITAGPVSVPFKPTRCFMITRYRGSFGLIQRQKGFSNTSPDPLNCLVKWPCWWTFSLMKNLMRGVSQLLTAVAVTVMHGTAEVTRGWCFLSYKVESTMQWLPGLHVLIKGNSYFMEILHGQCPRIPSENMHEGHAFARTLLLYRHKNK